jgi:hypothetical protein
MRNKHCTTWNIVKNLTNEENEELARYGLEYGEKHRNRWKMRNTYCRTWTMARKLTNKENEKFTC